MVSVDAPKTKAKGSKDKQAGSEIAPPRADTAPDDLPDDRQSLIEQDAETLEETQQETLEETLQETLSPAAAQRSLPEGTEDELAEVEVRVAVQSNVVADTLADKGDSVAVVGIGTGRR
jgi:hypothetical protein